MGGGPIASRRHAAYRLKLAQGFLGEARQDVDLGRWRSSVDSAQLSVENAGKAALALFGPTSRTHNPATQIRRLVGEARLDAALSERLERLAELAELLGPDIHIQTDYGDEAGGRTPWELFDERCSPGTRHRWGGRNSRGSACSEDLTVTGNSANG